MEMCKKSREVIIFVSSVHLLILTVQTSLLLRRSQKLLSAKSYQVSVSEGYNRRGAVLFNICLPYYLSEIILCLSHMMRSQKVSITTSFCY